MVVIKDISNRGTPTQPVFIVQPKGCDNPVTLEAKDDSSAINEVATRFRAKAIVCTLCSR
jgi:hypothetical protein